MYIYPVVVVAVCLSEFALISVARIANWLNKLVLYRQCYTTYNVS